MPNLSTNAIRAFAEKIRASHGIRQPGIQLSHQEAKNLNHEIQMLLAVVVEIQSQEAISATTPIDIEIYGSKF